MESDFFKNRLSPLLLELGFDVGEKYPNATVSASLFVGAVSIPFLIKYSENTSQDVTEEDIKLFYADLNLFGATGRGVKGLFVASHRYTQGAAASAKELGIALTTYDQLLSSTVNFDNYLKLIIFEYEQKNDLYKTYISQNVRTLTGDYVPLQTQLEEWLDSGSKNLLFILSESGTGKTSFSKTFAYTLASSYTNQPEGIPIPIFIELKDYKNTFNLSNLIIYHLFNVHNLQLRSFNVFAHLLKEGRLVLILDGFDELISDPDSSEAQIFMQELFLLATGKSKIILTSRPEYFLHNPDEATRAKFDSSKIFERFHNKENYSLITLRPFKYDQIERYVKLKTGSENKTLMKNIQTDKKLREIAKYPILLELLLETGIKNASTKSALYDTYVDKWLNDENWMVHLTKEGKQVLARELAWLLWSQDKKRVHYTELPELLSQYVKKEFKQKRDNDYLLTDIQATPFMKNMGGYCSFIHDSFVDYFASRHIVKMIEEDDRSFTSGRYVTRTLAEFLCEIAGAEKIYEYFSQLLKTSSSRKVKAYAVTALYNLNEFIKENKADISKELFRTISEGVNFRNYELMGVDLAYARLSHASFRGASLAYAVLRNASLFSADFENADLSKCVLEKADFRYGCLRHVNLINADASFALFQETDMTGAICVEAKMVEVNLMNADCSDVKFNQANLHAVLAVNSIMRNSNFNKADLQNSDFCGSDFESAVFNETNLNHVLFEDASLKRAVLNTCYVWGAEFMFCNFTEAALSNLDMKNVKLAYSTFHKTVFTNVQFELADLRNADFKNAVFIDVNFEDADLRGAVFTNCDFDKTSAETLKLAYGYQPVKEKSIVPKKNNTEKPEKTPSKPNKKTNTILPKNKSVAALPPEESEKKEEQPLKISVPPKKSGNKEGKSMNRPKKSGQLPAEDDKKN